MENTKNIVIYNVYSSLEKLVNDPNGFLSSSEREHLFNSIEENPEIIKDIISTKEGKKLIASIATMESEEEKEIVSDLLILLGGVRDEDSISEIVKASIFTQSGNIQRIIQDSGKLTKKDFDSAFENDINNVLNLLEYQNNEVSLRILQNLGADLLADCIIKYSDCIEDMELPTDDYGFSVISPREVLADTDLFDNTAMKILEIVYENDIWLYSEILKIIYNPERTQDTIEEGLDDYENEDRLKFRKPLYKGEERETSLLEDPRDDDEKYLEEDDYEQVVKEDDDYDF